MIRNISRIALLLGCLWVAGCGVPKTDPGTKAKMAPDFPFLPLNGSAPFQLSSLRGKVVVLEFWAAWCPDCIREMPKQKELMAAFQGKDVVFLGLAHPRGGAEKILATVQKYGLKSLQMIDKGSLEDGSDRLAKTYQVEWIPTVIFLDRQGRMRGRQKSIEGLKYLDAKVTIQKLLAE
jgi:thiol-disulfide isomerase/thioredoxin